MLPFSLLGFAVRNDGVKESNCVISQLLQ